MLYVATAGLIINVAGLFIFGHGHSHSVPTEAVRTLEELDSIENDEIIEMESTITTLTPSIVQASPSTIDDLEASKCLVNQQNRVAINDRNNITNKKKSKCFCCSIFSE